ncbi:PRC-barrel domain containing protein [Streptomyces sp. NPDC050535]|uniref:PRC-barrel domain containing protein n=1 Tax=Streptomyces sp. NPDC050535 TaxID=3365626 RepID=UPI00379E9441
MHESLWNYTPTSGHTPDDDLTGYAVEATDGHIGTVDKHSGDVVAQYIVVDTGVWIFGRQVMLPAGTVVGIDHEAKKVHVSRSKAEIKASPEFDKDKHLGDPAYRDQLGGHYGSGH